MTATRPCDHVSYDNACLARNTAWLLKAAKRANLRARICTSCGQWRLVPRKTASQRRSA